MGLSVASGAILRAMLYRIARRRIVARLLSAKRPAILIVSYPRSGSSWIGAVLSKSESVLYMREPITQPYLGAGGKYALVDIDRGSSPPESYLRLSAEAFAGIPNAYRGVVEDIKEFLSPRRRHKQLLIKEINPRALAYFCSEYAPTVVLILRHPAAVALSFSQRGWLNCEDTQTDIDGGNTDAWKGFGYTYGSVMRHAIETIRSSPESVVISYEEFALDPRSSFKIIFNRLSLEIPAEYESLIEQYCFSENAVSEAYGVARKSVDEIYKWKRELTESQIASIRTGYLTSGIDRYRDDMDWG